MKKKNCEKKTKKIKRKKTKNVRLEETTWCVCFFFVFLLTWKSNIILCPNVLKLYTSSKPLLSLTCIKKDIPNIAKINITKNSSKQILNNAGNDMAKANNNVRMPFAPLTKRSTRPTFATRTTRNNVGDTKYFSIISLSTRPKINN